MKVTFELPDIKNATTEQVQNAIAYAQTVFEESLSNRGEVSPEENEAADIRESILANRDREEVLDIIRELVKENKLVLPVGCQQEYDEPMNTEPQPEDKDEPEYVGMAKYKMGIPSDEDWEKMKRYLPNGGYGAKKQEYLVAAFVASNNFVWRSFGKWSTDALKTMTMQYPSKPFLTDHHDYIGNVKGFVYDSEYVNNIVVARNILESVNKDANYEILNSEGYNELITKVAFVSGSDFAEKMRKGMYDAVSTGSLVNTNKYKCPLDGTYFGEGKRWYQCAHGHNMPSPSLIYWYYDEEDIENIAPYYEVEEVTDTVELSMVTMGNLPGARMIKSR